MSLVNQTIIDEWSNFSKSDLAKFGDEGDEARKILLDPNILKLAGDLNGKKVLDAGCGNGHLSRKLAKLGADVTGIEPSDSLYQYCVKREQAEPLGIHYVQQDLSSLNSTDTYDMVFLINVLMDIPDYALALKNCINALKSGGTLILSILHPAFPGFEADWQELGKVEIKEYFNPEPIKQKYGYLFHRPLQDYMNLLIESGCSIEKLVEPKLEDDSSRSAHVPQFLIIKARKRA
jgi:2-polyprenyl-3-methyl-5-hydroxy-6-metoxy-1,4-benzoquinol methylase